MKVLMITGSRTWKGHENRLQIFEQLGEYDPDEWVVIHGGANGADKMAGEVAVGMGFEVQVYPADWVKHGRSAGFRRNWEMARVADECLAFWDGQSRGTKHAIDAARDKDVPTKVIWPK